MHRPRFYALLRAFFKFLYFIDENNQTTNPKRNKHLQYIKLSSYAAIIMLIHYGGCFFEDYRTIIIVELSLSLPTSNQNIYETYF